MVPAELLSVLSLLLAAAAMVALLRTRRALLAERRQAEAAARRQALLLRDLTAAGMALLGRAQTLADGRAVEGDARQLLALLDAAAEDPAPAATPRHLRETSFPLGALVEEAVAIAAAQLGPGRRHWRVAPDVAAVALTADRRALRGALVQVLGRAARATREGDSIAIALERRGPSAALVVEDEGLGLGPEDLAPEALDGATDRTRGLGFGLAVARDLLRAHGGELAMEAVRGVGARAYLILPPGRVRPA
ncbi:MAG: ATP-binding protein [Acetobacteraceae bacterium]|nr:ATP-binding protein [Acetobacteraceae bacterium]